MTRLLPQERHISISRSRDLPTSNQLEKLQHLLVLLPTSPTEDLWQQLPHGELLAALTRRRPAKASAPLGSHLPGAGRTGVSVGFLKSGDPLPKLQSELRKLTALVLAESPESIGIVCLGFDDSIRKMLQGDTISALMLNSFDMPSRKSDPKPASRLRRLRVFAPAPGLDLTRIRAEVDGNNLARWLSALPPNKLDAAGYRAAVAQLAKREDWQMKFLDESALRKKGAGAFLAVSQGNPTDDAGIIRLRYRPKRRKGPATLALVGKGITFDTGGNNLKPFKGMLDMHEDMQGSAVALGTLLALSRIRYPHAVDCWLAVTENRIGAKAYKSRDIVIASNGVSIEVIHTDAEGRMVLADTLALACNDDPACIIDYATLTGACVGALTSRYSGVFSNRESLYPLLVECGADVGERVWGFPMDADFDEAIESSVADVAQCSVDNDGDHILAARFLGRFVDPGIPWVHIDLAASHHKGGLGLVPTSVTGFGVRLSISLLVDRQLLEDLAPGDDK
ncbi:MAG: leucyl aminopeptidase family protein [Gammaproteobacteria bacterium]